jgi:hypothetical protein
MLSYLTDCCYDTFLLWNVRYLKSALPHIIIHNCSRSSFPHLTTHCTYKLPPHQQDNMMTWLQLKIPFSHFGTLQMSNYKYDLLITQLFICIIFMYIYKCIHCQRHVKWVPCHHEMAHQADGLQISRVAVNILNKQLQTANRGWPSSLGVGWGAKNPQP